MHARTTALPGADTGVTARRRIARGLFRFLAVLLALCVVAQVALVGLSLFISPAWWTWHRMFGHLFGLVLLPPMFALTYIGHMSGLARRLTATAFALFIFQGATANIRGAAGVVHPVGALLLFWLAVTLARRERGTEAASTGDRERVDLARSA